MNLSKVNHILKNEPAYRLKQAKEAVFKHLISNWDEASGLSQVLRDRLNNECPLDIKAELYSSHCAKTEKAVMTLGDGSRIETVLMKHSDGRLTVCLSSQAGCPLGCGFCATGQSGFKRNLTADEIVIQILLFARRLKKKNLRVTGAVFMGMGEPLLNYDEVMKAVRILNDKAGLNIGARHISISTVGIAPGIRKLSGEPEQINLAVSIHTANERQRSELMPVNKQFNLKKIINSLNHYLSKTNRRVMIEYALIRGVNDTLEHAAELAKLLKTIDPPLYFVNLIACNPTKGYAPSDERTIMAFESILAKHKVPFTERHRFGTDIHAACGQLAGK
jgi:23S rRNA (adenine2503-C2)-methyltransferase